MSRTHSEFVEENNGVFFSEVMPKELTVAQTSDITISRVLVVRVSRTFVSAQGRTRRTETVILQ